jgi:uncharacterized protein (DUF4415 family)
MSKDTTSKTSADSVTDRPYNPDDEEAVAGFWEGASITLKGKEIGKARRPGQRGTQKAPTKVSTTVRLDPKVLEYFRATGSGWQTRLNDVLREYVASHR